MELLEHVPGGTEIPQELSSPVVDVGERAARRALRAQIERLERELSNAFVTAFSMGGLNQDVGQPRRQARLLDLGELEHVRDDLVERLSAARRWIAKRADEQAASRLALEQMLLEPGKHRFERVSCGDLGQPGCGVWEVRPRLGLIGMLMGWWQVKLSSGCPLAEGHGARHGPHTGLPTGDVPTVFWAQDARVAQGW
jgi:hypothetical protein